MKKVLVKQDCTTQDIMNLVLRVIHDQTEVLKLNNFAKRFARKTRTETAKAVHDFLLNEVNYKADGTHQIVQAPARMLFENESDCKSWTVFTAAIFKNLKIPFVVRFASYDSGDYTHVYPLVIDERGKLVAADAVYTSQSLLGFFGSEKEYKRKKDYIFKPL
jgi:hypothetical protein